MGVLVLVHEYGHFIMARREGMKVEEFGFGFPPRLFSIKKGETIYSINWIPFGGFVKIMGEDGELREVEGSFGSKPISARLKVIVAGVTMNLLFAVFLLILGNFFGLRIGLFDEELIKNARDKKVQIVEVVAGSPAEKAGLKVLDEIFGFLYKNQEIRTEMVEEVQNFTGQHKGEKITILIRRGTEITPTQIEPRVNPPPGEGSMGIAMALTGIVSYPWYEAIWRGAYDTYIISANTVYGYGILLKSLFLKGKLIAEVSGPIGIAGITGQAAKVGFSYLMQFVAMISINLAILNIAPLPALDGGRLVFLIVEKMRGKPMNKKIETMVNGVGFALLITLMIYVTIKDIAKFFTV